MNNLPIKGYPQNAIFYLEDFLTKELNRKEIKHFSIDSSNDLYQVIEKFQCSFIQKLYENLNVEYVKDVKQGLLKSFQYHLKFKKMDIEISDKGVRKPHFVYIAIWQYLK